jgi:putative acetyltransferase
MSEQASEVSIRPETIADRPAVYELIHAAFTRENEARLVESLRGTPAFIPELSLVAHDGTRPVAHILFTRIVVRDGGEIREALALAPLAVLPELQKRGFGSALVRHGLAAARELGHRVVIVLGHPDYYPRFGFVPAPPLGIHPPFAARSEAFMALALQPGALQSFRGRVEYPPEFAEASAAKGTGRFLFLAGLTVWVVAATFGAVVAASALWRPPSDAGGFQKLLFSAYLLLVGFGAWAAAALAYRTVVGVSCHRCGARAVATSLHPVTFRCGSCGEVERARSGPRGA